jgi:hypothetical protein
MPYTTVQGSTDDFICTLSKTCKTARLVLKMADSYDLPGSFHYLPADEAFPVEDPRFTAEQIPENKRAKSASLAIGLATHATLVSEARL